MLNYTHTNSIDVIYIDPSYNNGKRTWKYNNNYIDSKDVYKHSKWLSMMANRMRLAVNFLKEDGVFICAIDENELEALLMLITDIFGDDYVKETISIVHNPRGIQGDNFSYVHEYAIFVYKKGKKVVTPKPILKEDVEWSPLRNWGDESSRYDAANCFYPIIVKDNKIIGFGDDITNEDIHPKQTEYHEDIDAYYVYPIDKNNDEKKWRYERGTVEGIIEILRVKKIESLNSGKGPTTKQKVIVVDELRHKYLLKVLLKISGLKKSTYEYYKSQKHLNVCKKKDIEDNKIVNQIKEIFNEHKSRYGYRRVHLELKKTIKINHKKVQRIMRENNLRGIHPKVKYHSYKGDNGHSKQNLLLYSSKAKRSA